jgi:hypothetical protein
MIEKKPIAKSLKEGVKNLVKISREQYNRLFENEISGGINRVDKTFKKELSLKNTKKVNEDENVENEDPLKAETIELIKYLYRKSEKLSPFWEQNGMDYDSICDTLLSKKLIVKNGGRYELAKSLGNPQSAIQAVEDALRTHIKPQVEEPIGQPELETEDSAYPAGAAHASDEPDSTKPNKPSHTQLKPIAFNREIILFKTPDGAMYVFYHDNVAKDALKDYASLTRHYVGKDEDGQPEYDYDDDFEINADVISNYVNDNLESLSKGEGLEAYEQGTDLVKLDDSLKQELLGLYDKDKNITQALNPIDEAEFSGPMKSFKDNVVQASTNKPKIEQSKIVAKLAELKAKEGERRKAEADAISARRKEQELEEMTSSSSSGSFTAPLGGDIVKKEIPTPVVSEESKLGKGYTHFAVLKSNNKIVDGWDYKGLENDEIKHWTKIDLTNNFPDNKISDFKVVSRGFLVRNNINPEDTNNWLKTFDTTIDEATTVASAGNFQYDTPGGLTMDLGKSNPKTRAEKTTQWAGGSFVKQPDCSKPNNNKSAQNGGCNSGASSLKTIKTGGSINAPSLGENYIYETIAKKTGKTLDEVKRIIESKKTKA